MLRALMTSSFTNDLFVFRHNVLVNASCMTPELLQLFVNMPSLLGEWTGFVVLSSAIIFELYVTDDVACEQAHVWGAHSLS